MIRKTKPMTPALRTWEDFAMPVWALLFWASAFGVVFS